MDAFIILGISIAFQFAAAILALRLIPVTGRRKAWVFISAAIFLMAVRRCVTLFQMGYGGLEQPRSASTEEWVTLATSMLMLAGIASIAPLLHSMRQSTEAIRESEEKYRTLFEDSKDAIFVSSRDGRFLEVNRAMLDLFGFTPEEMIGMDVHNVYVCPEDRPRFQQEIEQKGSVRDYEMRFRKKDGTEMDCLLTSTLQRGRDGNVVRYRGIVRDVTQYKQTMDMVKAERQRFFSLLDKLPGFVDLQASDYSIQFANSRFREIFGDPSGKHCYEIMRCRSEPCEECRTQVVFETNRPQSFEKTHSNGRVYQICHYPYTGPDGSLLVLELGIDITDRKLAEDSLRESEAKFRSLAETVPAAILIYQDDKFIYANPAAEAIAGYTREELLTMNYWDLVPADFREIVKERGMTRQQGKQLDSQQEFVIMTKSGVRRWIDSAAASINFDGRPAGLVVAFDVTERKQMEAALRESEERYRELVQNAHSIILKMDTQGNIVFFNEFAQSFFGYTEEEIIGRNIMGTIFLRTEPGGGDLATLVADIARNPDQCVTGEGEAIRRNGERVWISCTHKAILDRDGSLTGILCIGNDITQLKLLEEQYRQSQRLEAIGQLAGGIAHDFNNLLGVITGYTDLALRKLPQDNPLLRNLEHIRDAGEKATSLTRQLLAFSRRQILELKVLNLNKVILEMEPMLRRLIGEDIDLATALDPELVPVKVDPGQIEQIIMNLAVNARDAMPDGGRLTIETANVELDETYARQHVSVKPGWHVMLAVSDSGMGIDKEVLPHIFEPFFTTKGVEKGTGLGLATVYGIVKQSGGNIWVYTVPGQGTTFKIYFLQAGEELQIPKRATVASGLTQGKETILLVEDDEMFQAMICQILRENGYTVLEARNGAEAMRISDQYRAAPIHLMLTDVVMPGMNGRRLAEHLSPLRPEMKVLFMSGYTDNAIVHHGVLDHGKAFVQKPFTPDFLLQKVRELLAETMDLTADG